MGIGLLKWGGRSRYGDRGWETACFKTVNRQKKNRAKELLQMKGTKDVKTKLNL